MLNLLFRSRDFVWTQLYWPEGGAGGKLMNDQNDLEQHGCVKFHSDASRK